MTKNFDPACKIYYVNVSVVRIMLEKPLETLQRVGQNTITQHLNQNVQHIKKHTEHLFNWSILCNAPSNNQIRKNLEALFIGIMKPSVNEQTNFDCLTLFRNSITKNLMFY